MFFSPLAFVWQCNKWPLEVMNTKILIVDIHTVYVINYYKIHLHFFHPLSMCQYPPSATRIVSVYFHQEISCQFRRPRSGKLQESECQKQLGSTLCTKVLDIVDKRRRKWRGQSCAEWNHAASFHNWSIAIIHVEWTRNSLPFRT